MDNNQRPTAKDQRPTAKDHPPKTVLNTAKTKQGTKRSPAFTCQHPTPFRRCYIFLVPVSNQGFAWLFFVLLLKPARLPVHHQEKIGESGVKYVWPLPMLPRQH